MPELPEVETVRRSLLPHVTDREIRRAEARRPDLRWPLPAGFGRRLGGRRILTLDRRGKYLLWRLAGGMTMISHLGMSGRFLVAGAEPGAEPGPHDHVVLHLAPDPGRPAGRILYQDPRRFGAMDFCPPAADSHPWLARLGPEPLGPEFTAGWLADRLRGRRAPVKPLLLDQSLVAGFGNIYASEALHRAGIAPARAGGRIGPARIRRLHAAMRQVLGEAIEAGGSSLRDFRQAEGDPGRFQHAFAVYGRSGEGCRKPGCGGVLRTARQSGRSTFWCPACQR